MHVRLVRGKPQPGQVDELARLRQEILAPRMKSEPRFRHAYFVGNRDTNSVIGIQVWDTLPDRAIMSQFRERVRDITIGPPEIEDYELLAEV